FPGCCRGLPNLDLAPAPRTKPLLGGVEGLGSLGASHTVAALSQGAAQSGWSVRGFDQLGDLAVRLLAEIPGRVEAGEGAQCHLRAELLPQAGGIGHVARSKGLQQLALTDPGQPRHAVAQREVGELRATLRDLL